MALENYGISKFLGSNTGKGFKGFYADLLYGSGYYGNNQSVYILKGGPGTGKSTFIRKVAALLQKKDCDTELLLCSGDVKSLDGVISKSGGITVVDGTNPHGIEPVCAGVHENIINLGVFWNKHILRKYSGQIEELFAKKKIMYKKAYRYLASAYEIYRERADIIGQFVDYRKMKIFAEYLADELISEKDDSACCGIMRRAFATAVTSKGVFGKLPCYDNLGYDGLKVYCIMSKFDIPTGLILETVAEKAVLNGYDTDLYYCGFDSEKLEHIVIPELGLAIVTSNEYHRFDNQNTEQEIVAEGFLKESVNVSREKCMEYDIGYAKIRFDELSERAFRALGKASEYHHEMEDYYVEAMDFKALNEYADCMLDEMSMVIRDNIFG